MQSDELGPVDVQDLSAGAVISVFICCFLQQQQRVAEGVCCCLWRMPQRELQQRDEIF